jgi:cyclic beta-1,2-glucan synthetase
MSFLAILNLLHGNIVQRWFHSNPLVRSTELLLNELPARKAVLRAKARESSPIRTAVSKAV